MKAKMKAKMKRNRLFSFLFTLMMVVGILSAMRMTALAAVSSASGTEEDPYIAYNYEELMKLMEDAPQYKVTYIKLGSDVSYSGEEVLMYLTLVSDAQSVVLDLNGHAITRSGTSSDLGVVYLDEGTLTIRDSSEDSSGSINNRMTGGTGSATLYVAGGNLVIEDGDFFVYDSESPSVIYTYGGNTFIYGGRFWNMTKEGWMACFDDGTVTVDGAHFRIYSDSLNDSVGMYISTNADVTLRSCFIEGGSKGVLQLNGTKIPEGSVMTESESSSAGLPSVRISTYTDKSIVRLAATVTKPLHGNFPDDYVTAGAENDVTNYTATIDKWYETDSVVYPSNAMKTGDTFVGGKTYVLQVRFTPKSGYAIRADRNVTINGEQAYFCPSESRGGSVVYRTTFKVTGDIAKVAMTSNLSELYTNSAVTAPSFNITEGKPVYVQNGKWQKYDNTLNKWSDYSGKTFEAGKYRYAVQLCLNPDDYENYLMNEDVTVIVDGKIWNVDNKNTWESSNKVVKCMAYSPVYTTVQVSEITIPATSYIYDGKEKTPVVTVKNSKGKVLSRGKDYTLTYSPGRIEIGTYKIKVTMIGNYSGGKTLSYTIVPGQVTGLKQWTSEYSASRIKMSWKKVAGAEGYALYRATKKDGTYKYLKSVTTTPCTNEGLKAGSKYYYKVRAYKTVSGNKVFGKYSDVVFMVTKPGAPTITLTAGSKSAKIAWTKSTSANGYEVYMSTKKDGTYTKIKTAGASTLSYTKTGLKSGQKYYIKVRAYMTHPDGSKIYSGWSTVKSVTPK